MIISFKVHKLFIKYIIEIKFWKKELKTIIMTSAINLIKWIVKFYLELAREDLKHKVPVKAMLSWIINRNCISDFISQICNTSQSCRIFCYHCQTFGLTQWAALSDRTSSVTLDQSINVHEIIDHWTALYNWFIFS